MTQKRDSWPPKPTMSSFREIKRGISAKKIIRKYCNESKR